MDRVNSPSCYLALDNKLIAQVKVFKNASTIVNLYEGPQIFFFNSLSHLKTYPQFKNCKILWGENEDIIELFKDHTPIKIYDVRGIRNWSINNLVEVPCYACS